MINREKSINHHPDTPQLAEMYESLAPEELNSWFESYLPQEPDCILDIGTGSCRDAAWLASKEHQVVAIEPSSDMRRQAQRFHSAMSFKLVDDQLPDLKISRSGMSFKLILLNACGCLFQKKNGREVFANWSHF